MLIFKKDRQVTAYYDLATDGPGAGYQKAKIGMQFRRSAGEVKNLYWRITKNLDNRFNVDSAHHLSPGRPGLHMAVLAGEVAAITEVHLQDIYCLRAEGQAANFPQRLSEFIGQDRFTASKLD